MLRKPERVARFEREDTRRRYGDLSYPEALRLFEAMWAHAAAIDPGFIQRDLESGLESALAIARAVNGLPPRA
jgi:hypothetical protein